MQDKINQALDKIRPILKADHGDIELIDVDEKNKIVKVKMVGACAGCPMAAFTLKAHVERIIKEHVPEIKEVIAI